MKFEDRIFHVIKLLKLLFPVRIEVKVDMYTVDWLSNAGQDIMVKKNIPTGLTGNKLLNF